MLYFAYGSNMSASRLRARVGEVDDLGHAISSGQRLVFSALGKGPCFAAYAPADGRSLHGRLFDLHPLQLDVLDIYEGSPVYYHRAAIVVDDGFGRPANIATTFARNPNAVVGLPSRAYENHLLDGYVAMAMGGADMDAMLDAHIEAVRFTIEHEGRKAG